METKIVELQSNINLKVPLDFNIDLNLGIDLVKFIKTNNMRVSKRTALVANDYGHLGFETLCLGTTNSISYISNNNEMLEVINQVAYDAFIPFNVRNELTEDILNYNTEEKFDMAIGIIPTVDNFMEHIHFCKFVLENVDKLGDVYLIEKTDNKLLKACLVKNGLNYESTYSSENFYIHYLKLQHDNKSSLDLKFLKLKKQD